MSKLLHLFLKNPLTLSLAESMTGGALSYSFVKESGASNYFKGSLVAYGEDIKKKLLPVSEEMISTHGVVSQEVALGMAKGALLLFDSDISLGVTGFAGPLGDDVGKVAFAIASKKNLSLSQLSFFKGDRESIIEQTIVTIHQKLYEYLSVT